MTDLKRWTMTEAPTSGRPYPAMTPDTQFFWDAVAEGRLAIQQCSACGQLRHPPGPACPSCHSLEWKSTTVSGRGTLYSYMVQHHPPAPGFTGPALVVVVELEEGPRIVSNLTGVDPADVRIGEPLVVWFLEQKEGWTVPQFRRPGSAD